MRTTLATLTAVGLFLAAPAVAQQTQPGQQQAPSAQQDQSSQPGAGTAPQAQGTAPDQQGRTTDRAQQTQADPPVDRRQQAQTGQPGQPRAMSTDRLRQVLEGAGFQQIQIIDAAYLVQAQTEDGDTVFMMINPPVAGGPSATGATGTGQQPGAGGESQSQTGGETQRGTGATEPNPPQQNR